MSPFQISKSNPSDEELAALATVIAALLSAPEPSENVDRPATGNWGSHWYQLRHPFVYGPQAWSSSLRRF